MPFEIGDLVKISYSRDLTYGIITKVHTYHPLPHELSSFAPIVYHYDVFVFFDKLTDYHISQKWVSYAEDPIAPYNIENCNQPITDK